MSRFYIKDVRYDVASYGPSGIVVGEAEILTEDNEQFFISLTDVDGFPSVFKTEVSTLDKQIDSTEDDAFWDDLNEHALSGGDYDEICDGVDEEYIPLVKYLAYIVRTDYDICDAFIEATSGHWIDEIEVPEYEDDDEYDEEDLEDDEE